MIRVSDLFDHILKPTKPHPMLLCKSCGGEYSANKGDYWNHPQDHVFECCGEPMVLVHKQTTYTEV